MGRIRLGKSGSLQIDFQYMGTRCREQTALPDTAANRKTLEKLIQKIEAEILLGTFVYSNYFPNSKMVARFEKQQQRLLELQQQKHQQANDQDFAQQGVFVQFGLRGENPASLAIAREAGVRCLSVL